MLDNCKLLFKVLLGHSSPQLCQQWGGSLFSLSVSRIDDHISVAFSLPPYMGIDRDIRCYLKQTPCSSIPQLVIMNVTLISFLEKWNKIFFKIYLTKFCPNVKGIHDHFVKFGQKCIFFMLFRRFFAWNKKIIKSLAILSQNYQNIRILRHVLGKHSRT